MKFKVGDRVKHEELGKGTIQYIDNDNYHLPYAVEFDERFMTGHICAGYCKDKHGFWCNENELELIKPKQFTKSDLQGGDIVIYKDKHKAIVTNCQLKFYSINEPGMMYLTDYDENLKYKTGYHKDTIYDIIKVERPVKYEIVFERKEEILDKTEKRYLSGVIRPFRDNIDYIRKRQWNYEECYIVFGKKGNIRKLGSLPAFNKDTMYKGMKVNRDYTLEELGI